MSQSSKASAGIIPVTPESAGDCHMIIIGKKHGKISVTFKKENESITYHFPEENIPGKCQGCEFGGKKGGDCSVIYIYNNISVVYNICFTCLLNLLTNDYRKTGHNIVFKIKEGKKFYAESKIDKYVRAFKFNLDEPEEGFN